MTLISGGVSSDPSSDGMAINLAVSPTDRN